MPRGKTHSSKTGSMSHSKHASKADSASHKERHSASSAQTTSTKAKARKNKR